MLVLDADKKKSAGGGCGCGGGAVTQFKNAADIGDGEAAFFSDGDEVAEVAQVHFSDPWCHTSQA